MSDKYGPPRGEAPGYLVVNRLADETGMYAKTSQTNSRGEFKVSR